jgi:hypothetical protein
MKKIIVVLLMFFAFQSKAQICYFQFNFDENFRGEKVDFYINEELIFENRKLESIPHAGHTNDEILFTRNEYNTFYVTEIYSSSKSKRSGLKIRYLSLGKKWNHKNLTLKFVVNKVEYIREISLENGHCIAILYNFYDKNAGIEIDQFHFPIAYE